MVREAAFHLMFAEAFLSQAAGYFTLVGLVFLVVWKWGERRFEASRIQAKKRFTSAQLTFEVRNTLVTFALGTLNAVAISTLYARGHTRLTTDPDALGWLTIAATFVALIVFNDAWFYAWHRALHHPKLFRHVHAVHHKSVDVNPFSSYSFHALEGLILGAWVIPVLMFVPMYLPMLGALQLVGLLNNVMSHLGYEFLPSAFTRVPPFRWMNTATFHNLHHTRFKGNYGLFFRWWDQLLGTEVPEYEETFLARATRGDPDAPPAAPRAAAPPAR